MGLRRECMRLWILVLFFSIASTFFAQCESRRSKQSKGSQELKFLTEGGTLISKASKMKPLKHFDIYPTLEEAASPFSLPPLDESTGNIAPNYMPENTPPFCVYPPFTPLPPFTITPQPPSTITPTPMINTPPSPPLPSYSPPPPNLTPSPPVFVPGPPEYSPVIPNPPEYVPSPPSYVPNPPEYVPSPPNYEPSPPNYEPSPPGYVPSPPEYVPSPPKYVPSPPEFVPGPPVFQPPVVYPPPSGPPPRSKGPSSGLWCVAKPTVPDPIIQEAMDYACGSGADCMSIEPNGACFKPDTLIRHASFAFNSYWQRTKAAGGTCDFGGTGMLITVDPSIDGCHFMLA